MSKRITDMIRDENKKRSVKMDLYIFEDLKKIQDEGKFKIYKHKSFAYTYIWICSYLWKYSIYGEHKILPQDINELVGYSPINKTINYITKSGGLTDTEGFTETSRDFPVYTEFGTDKNIVVHHISNEEDPDVKSNFFEFNGNRYCYKKPLHQLERLRNGEIKEGLIYSREDFFRITISEYNIIMSDEKCGATEFYIYSYMKRRCKMRGFSKVQIYINEIANDLGCSYSKACESLNHLRRLGLLECKTKTLSNGESIRKENIYSIPNKYGKHTKIKYMFNSSQEHDTSVLEQP